MTAPAGAASPADAPDYTVGICTWNRAALLRRTLASLEAVEAPAGRRWEVLVVDNASTDDTPRLLAEFRDRLPLRVVREPRQGVSFARNTATEQARGTVIVWTDDDVLVPPHWLRAYEAAITAHPEAEFFGGPIVPAFDGTPPPHVRAALARVPFAFAALDYGAEPGPLAPEPERWAFTANMAIRRATQQRVLYDTLLGRRRRLLVGGEDTTLIREIWDAGGIGWWVPEARVEHIIPPERQTVAFLRRYFEGKGAQNARTCPEGPLPRWAVRQAVASEMRFRARRRTRPPEVWLEDLRLAATAWGFLRESWYRHRSGRAAPA